MKSLSGLCLRNETADDDENEPHGFSIALDVPLLPASLTKLQLLSANKCRSDDARDGDWDYVIDEVDDDVSATGIDSVFFLDDAEYGAGGDEGRRLLCARTALAELWIPAPFIWIEFVRLTASIPSLIVLAGPNIVTFGGEPHALLPRHDGLRELHIVCPGARLPAILAATPPLRVAQFSITDYTGHTAISAASVVSCSHLRYLMIRWGIFMSSAERCAPDCVALSAVLRLPALTRLVLVRSDPRLCVTRGIRHDPLILYSDTTPRPIIAPASVASAFCDLVRDR
jgi:hypothetical protein